MIPHDPVGIGDIHHWPDVGFRQGRIADFERLRSGDEMAEKFLDRRFLDNDPLG